MAFREVSLKAALVVWILGSAPGQFPDYSEVQQGDVLGIDNINLMALISQGL